MTLEDLKKAVEMAEKFGSPDCKIYLRQRNKRTQYETESATFACYRTEDETLLV